MIELGVNIDHVATLRQARRGTEPDPVWAAVEAELGGADSITVHLREDRRHISDRDVRILRQTVQCKLNLEMSLDDEIVGIAVRNQAGTGDVGARTPRGDHHRRRAGLVAPAGAYCRGGAETARDRGCGLGVHLAAGKAGDAGAKLGI